MELQEARARALAFLEPQTRRVNGGIAILDERTITKPYGWVFFYDSKRHIETQDMKHAIAGNGPVIVIAVTGEVVTLGTARRSADEIAEFERTRGFG